MASGSAWSAGWNLGAGYAAERFAHKQELRDAELNDKIGQLIDNRKSLQAKLPTLLDDKGNPTPEYTQTVDALTQNARDLREIYHPQKNPGAIEKFGHLLTDALHLTSQEQRQAKQQSQQQKLHTQDVAEAKRLVAAAPLSPEQQSVTQARTLAAGRMAAIQQAVKDFATLNPNATEEEKQAFLNDQITKEFGTSIRGSWTNVSGKMNGKDVTLLFDKNTRQYRLQNGEEVPPEMLATFVPDTKTSATDQKHAAYLDYVEKFVPKKAGDQPLSEIAWAAQQSALGRSAASPTNPEARHIQVQAKMLQGETLTPEEQAFEKSYQANLAQKEAFQERVAQMRGVSYGTARQMAPLPVYDTANNNSPTYATFLEMKKSPGRYIPTTAGAKAISQENLMEDLTGVSSNLRKDILSMREDFPEDMKAKIAVAMTSSEPSSALSMLVASGALGSLPPDQFQVYVDLQQLAENAMAMRSVLGAGQGSDDVRRAITRTLPSLLSPNKQDALIQLSAYDQTIARLRRGVPQVPLRTDIPGTGTEGGAPGPSAPQSKKRVSLAKAKLLPQNKGKTDEQITQDIESHGYLVVP